MKNVFGSSDSEESEHEPSQKPLKKLKIESEPPLDKTEPHEDYMSFPVEEIATKPATKKASLDTSLFNESSVGLSIMLKMGFQVGESLGSSGTALTEPIRVVPKKGRLGIGATSRIEQSYEEEKASKEVFVENRQLKHQQQREANAVSKLQRFCFRMSGDDDKVECKADAAKVHYLWRSVALQSVSELPSKRIMIDQTVEEPEEESVDGELMEFEAKQPAEQLIELIDFSRKTYSYCLYCLVQFDDPEDMAANCPGPDEKAHML